MTSGNNGAPHQGNLCSADDCAREAIHQLNTVQSIGILLVCHKKSRKILAYSANLKDLLVSAPDDVFCSSVDDILGEHIPWKDLFDNAKEGEAQTHGEHIGLLRQGMAELLLHVEPGSGGKHIIVEVMPTERRKTHQTEFEESLTSELAYAMQQLDKTHHFGEFAETSVRLVQKATQYDRVLLYRFDADWSGEVIAEHCAPEVRQKYLGLRFPANDIPAQARKLYTQNLLRIIASVASAPTPLITKPGLTRPTDQSYCLLRQPSENHIQYCRNMGVEATLTISLFHNNQLWGMVTCHHNSPIAPPFKLRRTIRLICRLMSYAISSQLNYLAHLQALQHARARQTFLETFCDAAVNKDCLITLAPTICRELCQLANAPCVALKLYDSWHLCGQVSVDCLDAIAASSGGKEFIAQRRKDLPAVFAQTSFSGAMVLPLNALESAYLVILREELMDTIDWGSTLFKTKAGEQATTSKLEPIASFEKWTQEIRGSCEHWQEDTIEFARKAASSLGTRMLSLQLNETNMALMVLGHGMERISYLVAVIETSPHTQERPTIVFANRSFLEHFGYQQCEIQGSGIDRVLQDDPRLAATCDSTTYQQMQRLLFRRKDGRVFTGEASVSPTETPHRKRRAYIVVIRDITPQLQIEQSLTHQRDMLKKVTSNVPGVIFHLVWYRHKGFHLVFANGLTRALLGVSPDSAHDVARAFKQRIVSADFHQLRRMLRYKSEKNQPIIMALRGRNRASDETWYEFNAVPHRDSDGQTSWFGFIHDVSERVKFEDDIARLNTDLRSTIQAIPDTLLEIDQYRRITHIHGAGATSWSDNATDNLGKSIYNLFTPNEIPLLRTAFNDALDNNRCRGVIITAPLAGDTRYLELSIAVKHLPSGEHCGYVCLARDITERKRAEAKISELAYFDPLTGLLNRRGFFDNFERIVSDSHRHAHYVALLYADLDNFKLLNDSHGHLYGDKLLQALSVRLQECLREEDLIARLGGDEFVILIHGMHTFDEAIRSASVLAQKITEEIKRPFTLLELSYRTSCSVGIAVSEPGERTTPSILMKRADFAMYNAKSVSDTGWCFFDKMIQEKMAMQTHLEQALRLAIDNETLDVYYQPIVNRERRLVGYEALLRWRMEDGSFVDPAVFVPLAERCGLVVDIGDFVLKRALRLLHHLAKSSATSHLNVSVNVSAKQVARSDFIDKLCDALAQHHVDPRLLTLEITETLVQENMENTINAMQRLQNYGVQFSLDDFGTGYSSLSYLKKLPITKLKIDRSFIKDITVNEESEAISNLIVCLAKTMGREVVAEGIEMEEQHQLLKALGCDYFQGFVYGKATPMLCDQ